MKRIVLATAFLTAVAYVTHAQQPVVYTTTTTTIQTDYTAQVPVSIRTNFQLANPTATDVTWMPASDWWYATYRDDNNRITRVYYNTQPYYVDKSDNFEVSLPVLNTYVPDDVVATAINMYGNNLFSITAAKTSSNPSYHVTLIRNGVSEVVTMNQAVAVNR